MKILYNTESLENAEGGISKASRLFLKYLNKKKTQNDLIINLNCYRSFENIYPYNVNISFAGSSKLRFFFNNAKGLVNNDLVIYDHIDLSKAHLNYFNKNYLIFGYGVDMWEMSNKQLDACKKAKKMFLCSEFTLSKMKSEKNQSFDNAEVCWLGSYDDKFQEKINVQDQDNKLNILILGRIDDHRKGHFEILNVWKELIKKHQNIRLNIVGKSAIKEQIIKKIKDYQIGNTVKYYGYVEESKIQTIWDNTNIFIMPGTVEGFGFVYIEAMKNSIPIIASTHDAGNEINKNNVTGFNIDQFDKKELFEALDVMIQNDDLRKKFSKNALKRFMNNFKFSDYEKRMDKIFLKLISQGI